MTFEQELAATGLSPEEIEIQVKKMAKARGAYASYIDCMVPPTDTDNIRSERKPTLTGLVRDNPATPEGKYLVKRRDGTIPEWPSFVLGARDPYAVPALLAYAKAAGDAGCNEQWVARIYMLATEFDTYRAEHGDGDPDKGVHRKDDPATVAEMRKGRSA